MKQLPNLTWLNNKVAIVRTQAGFKNALKIYCEGDLDRWEGYNYPKIYPSVCEFYKFYRGFHGVNLTSTPIWEYKKKLRESLEIIKEHSA